MIRLVFLYTVVILSTLTMDLVTGQGTQNLTPTPFSVESVLMAVFPRLDCNSIEPPYAGPTWNNITIGSSTLGELREYVRSLNPNYSEHSNPNLNITEFSVRLPLANAEDIPAMIAVCVDSDNETITGIYITPISPRRNVNNLVADYGVPNLVLWDELLESRVVVWLTEGIAASVSVDESEQLIPYGTIIRMVYFPYQTTLEGYEKRWPYTHRASSKAELVTSVPNLPYVVDPFDFEALIATITAEPSRTPTSTFVPKSAEPTATP